MSVLVLPVKQEFGKINIIIAINCLSPVTLTVALTLLSIVSNHACSPYFWHLSVAIWSEFFLNATVPSEFRLTGSVTLVSTPRYRLPRIVITGFYKHNISLFFFPIITLLNSFWPLFQCSLSLGRGNRFDLWRGEYSVVNYFFLGYWSLVNLHIKHYSLQHEAFWTKAEISINRWT